MSKTKKSKHLAIATIFMLCSSMAFAETVIRVNAASGAKAEYVISLVELAYKKLGKELTVERDQTQVTQGRINEEVKNGNLDLMWVSTNTQKEEEFLPVRIPLLKGLLGYRLMFIRENEQSKFNTIKTLDDLRTLKLGQGRTWSDTAILEANNITVVKAAKKDNLFHMLDGGRFDAFPRGASEPFSEIQHYSHLNIAIESNLVLAYKMPFYIFVNKNNHALAADIEKGLNVAIADGSFDSVFYRNPTVIDALGKARLNKRHIIELVNPTLPINTPVDRKELWLSTADTLPQP